MNFVLSETYARALAISAALVAAASVLGPPLRRRRSPGASRSRRDVRRDFAKGALLTDPLISRKLDPDVGGRPAAAPAATFEREDVARVWALGLTLGTLGLSLAFQLGLSLAFQLVLSRGSFARRHAWTAIAALLLACVVFTRSSVGPASAGARGARMWLVMLALSAALAAPLWCEALGASVPAGNDGDSGGDSSGDRSGDLDSDRDAALRWASWSSVALAGCALALSLSLSLSPPAVRRWPVPLNAEWEAGCLAYAFFSWLTPMIRVGFGKQLDLDDAPALAHGDRAATVFERALRIDGSKGVEGIGDKRGAVSGGEAPEGGLQRGGSADTLLEDHYDNDDSDCDHVDDDSLHDDDDGAWTNTARQRALLAAMELRSLWALGAFAAPWEFYTGACFQVSSVVAQFLPSLAINAILSCLEGDGSALQGAWALGLLALGPYLLGVSDTQRMSRGKRVGVRAQALLNGLILSKVEWSRRCRRETASPLRLGLGVAKNLCPHPLNRFSRDEWAK